MTTRELIQTEIERLGEEDLEELYSLIREFTRSRRPASEQSLMSKLQGIEIDAPEDFAARRELPERSAWPRGYWKSFGPVGDDFVRPEPLPESPHRDVVMEEFTRWLGER